MPEQQAGQIVKQLTSKPNTYQALSSPYVHDDIISDAVFSSRQIGHLPGTRPGTILIPIDDGTHEKLTASPPSNAPQHTSWQTNDQIPLLPHGNAQRRPRQVSLERRPPERGIFNQSDPSNPFSNDTVRSAQVQDVRERDTCERSGLSETYRPNSYRPRLIRLSDKDDHEESQSQGTHARQNVIHSTQDRARDSAKALAAWPKDTRSMPEYPRLVRLGPTEESKSNSFSGSSPSRIPVAHKAPLPRQVSLGTGNMFNRSRVVKVIPQQV